MNEYKSNAPLRAFYIFAASAIWLGIMLTGFSEASWVLYVPGITFVLLRSQGSVPA